MSKSWKPTGITYRHVNCVAENVKRGKYLGTIGMGRLASIILDLLKGPLKKLNHTVNHTPYRFPKWLIFHWETQKIPSKSTLTKPRYYQSPILLGKIMVPMDFKDLFHYISRWPTLPILRVGWLNWFPQWNPIDVLIEVQLLPICYILW